MKVDFDFDREKVKAMEMFMEQKGISFDAEMAEAAEGLYQKYVPGNVKAYIAATSKGRRNKAKTQDSSSSAVANGAGD